MIKFTVNEKDFELPESFEEMTLDIFLKISKLREGNTEYIFQELYLIKLLEAMTSAENGELDDMTLEQLAEISKAVKFLDEDPKPKDVKHFVISGVDYVFPENFFKMTTGEYISIKTLTDGKELSEVIPNLLSVILRPGEKVVDAETGKEKWKQKKFDANNLEYRKNLFKSLPVLDVLHAVNFFLTSSIPN